MKKSVICLVAAVMAACGPAEGANDDDVIVINNDENNGTATNGQNQMSQNDGTQNGTPGTTNNTPGTQSFNVRSGITTPGAARELRDDVRLIGVTAVFEASNQATGGQQLVTTGTLTQQGQQFTYAAGPDDKLRIVWSEGPPTDFYVTALQGDFEAAPQNFVRRPHNIQLRAVRDGVLDISINSQRQSGQEGFTLQGSVTLEGVTYEFDINETGTYKSSADFGAPEHDSETNLVGTVTGDNGFEQEVQEYFHFELVNDVTNDDRISNSTWTIDGKRYRLDNLHIRFEEVGGYPNVTDYWLVEGNVYEDDVLIGQAGWEANELVITIFIQVGTEKIELYKFQRRQ